MQSDLSSPKYGYDFVVATTQESINATMKEYLSGVAEPEVIMCYVMDTTGNPQVIDYKALVRLANNTDPFSVPNRANPATDEGVQNLAGAYFMYGIKAKIAMPRPHAVAISASAIPPVTAWTASSSLPRKLNERIRPVIVPNRPSNGASVTSVSITTKNRPARLISIPAATCNAPCNDAC